jgi:hypothetical protein
MAEGHKNATKTMTCQIDDLRLVAGNGICLVSAGLKIRSGVAVSALSLFVNLALCNRYLPQRRNKIQII